MPLKSYGCSVCGEQAPKVLRKEGQLEKRFKWLRRHYKKQHPREFKRWGR